MQVFEDSIMCEIQLYQRKDLFFCHVLVVFFVLVIYDMLYYTVLHALQQKSILIKCYSSSNRIQ